MEKEELFVPKEKHLGKIITIIILLLLFVGGIYCYYHFVYANPLNISKHSFEKIASIVNKKLDKVNTDSALEMNGLVNIKLTDYDDERFQNIVSNLDIQLNMQINEKKNIYTIETSSKSKGEKFVDTKSYIENGSLYVKSNEIYKDYLLVKNDFKVLTKKDLQIIFINTLNILKDEANKKAWKREKDNDFNKNYLQLNGKDVSDFITNVIDKIKSSKELINSLKLLDQNIEENLDKEINDIKSEEANTYTLAFYTEKGLTQNLTKIEQTINNKKITITIQDENNYLIETKNEEKEVKTKLTLSDKILNIYITSTNNEKTNTIDIKINYDNIESFESEDISSSKKKEELNNDEKNTIERKLQENSELHYLFHKLKELNTKSSNE